MSAPFFIARKAWGLHVRQLPRLTWRQGRVAWAMAETFSSLHGIAYASFEHLGERAGGIDRRDVSRAVAALVERGLIVEVSREDLVDAMTTDKTRRIGRRARGFRMALPLGGVPVEVGHLLATTERSTGARVTPKHSGAPVTPEITGGAVEASPLTIGVTVTTQLRGDSRPQIHEEYRGKSEDARQQARCPTTNLVHQPAAPEGGRLFETFANVYPGTVENCRTVFDLALKELGFDAINRAAHKYRQRVDQGLVGIRPAADWLRAGMEQQRKLEDMVELGRKVWGHLSEADTARLRQTALAVGNAELGNRLGALAYQVARGDVDPPSPASWMTAQHREMEAAA